MKLEIVLLVTLVASMVAAAPQKPGEEIAIISQDSNNEPDGSYQYSYETGDGTKAVEDGQLRTLDLEHAGEAVQGEYSYVGDDERTYNVKYTADERGFIPVGDHIPLPPPIPVAIARAIDDLATAKPAKETSASA